MDTPLTASRKNRPASVRIASAAAILGLAALATWFWISAGRKHTQRDTAGGDTRFGPAQVSNAEVTRRFLQIEADQDRVDQTVWATEEMAERHEDV